VPKDSQRFLKVVCKACSVFMLSPSSRSTAKPAAAWQLRYILFLEKVGLLRFKAATVITSEVFLWLTKKNY
jgi:hypothetical protein